MNVCCEIEQNSKLKCKNTYKIQSSYKNHKVGHITKESQVTRAYWQFKQIRLGNRYSFEINYSFLTY